MIWKQTPRYAMHVSLKPHKALQFDILHGLQSKLPTCDLEREIDGPVPVVDLFAGPGGLAEGFSQFRTNGRPAFKIVLSIEKEPTAFKTLHLRAFYRQFPANRTPKAYYQYLAGQITREELFHKHPTEAAKASSEAWNATLGVTDPR